MGKIPDDFEKETAANGLGKHTRIQRTTKLEVNLILFTIQVSHCLFTSMVAEVLGSIG